MFRSVIAQAVRDLVSTETKERTEVLEWLSTPDFDTICEFACVEPDGMREQLTRLAAMPLVIARKYGHELRLAVMRGVHGA